jgi:hypothetical protein
MMRPYNPPTIADQRPQWKRIGEASNDIVLTIERIDGHKIPVSRHHDTAYVMPFIGRVGRADLNDLEKRRDVLRESYRAALEVANYPQANELRELYLKAEDEMKREEVRIQQKFSTPFSY